MSPTSVTKSLKSDGLSDIKGRHLDYMRTRIGVHQDRLRWNSSQIAGFQTEKLTELLEHAKEHSRYYAKKFRGIDISRITPHDLSALPVTTKADIMDKWDGFVIDRRLTLEIANDFIENQRQFSYFEDQYLVLNSGGSSGLRGVFVWDGIARRIEQSLQE